MHFQSNILCFRSAFIFPEPSNTIYLPGNTSLISGLGAWIQPFRCCIIHWNILLSFLFVLLSFSLLFVHCSWPTVFSLLNTFTIYFACPFAYNTSTVLLTFLAWLYAVRYDQFSVRCSPNIIYVARRLQFQIAFLWWTAQRLFRWHAYVKISTSFRTDLAFAAYCVLAGVHANKIYLHVGVAFAVRHSSSWLANVSGLICRHFVWPNLINWWKSTYANLILAERSE